MSRFRCKTTPEQGTVISSIWKYVVVSINKDMGWDGKVFQGYNIWESSKHKTLMRAREEAARLNKDEAEYAVSRSRAHLRFQAVPANRYFVAEWTMKEG